MMVGGGGIFLDLRCFSLLITKESAHDFVQLPDEIYRPCILLFQLLLLLLFLPQLSPQHSYNNTPLDLTLQMLGCSWQVLLRYSGAQKFSVYLILQREGTSLDLPPSHLLRSRLSLFSLTLLLSLSSTPCTTSPSFILSLSLSFGKYKRPDWILTKRKTRAGYYSFTHSQSASFNTTHYSFFQHSPTTLYCYG